MHCNSQKEIFLQTGLDTPVNKPPDGQISGLQREQIPLVSRMEINPSFRACAKWRIPAVQSHIGE
jgi:hypothetical protein